MEPKAKESKNQNQFLTTHKCKKVSTFLTLLKRSINWKYPERDLTGKVTNRNLISVKSALSVWELNAKSQCAMSHFITRAKQSLHKGMRFPAEIKLFVGEQYSVRTYSKY